MNTFEFKAAIRPQLEAHIRDWLWFELDTPTMRAVAVGFRSHVKSAVIKPGSCPSLPLALLALPQNFNVDNTKFVNDIPPVLVQLFFVEVERYAHLDRSCTTILKIRAYEYRLKNMLAEIAYHARVAADASTVKFTSRRRRSDAKDHALPGATGDATKALANVAFF